MKLNLAYNEDNKGRNDHLHVDFAQLKDKKDKFLLDDFVDDGECSNIVALNMMDYLHYSETDAILSNWSKKLEHGGELVIGGTEVLDICKSLYALYLSPKQAQEFLYRPEVKTLHHVNDIRDKLKSFGLSIVSVNLQNYKFVIKAKRP